MMRFKVSKDGENLVVGDSRLATGKRYFVKVVLKSQ
jgi:hypothetical protein